MHQRTSPITITVALRTIMGWGDNVTYEEAAAKPLGGSARGKRGTRDPRTCP